MAQRDDLPFPFAPIDPDAPLRAVSVLVDGVDKTIRIARALADRRRPVDLAGLDNMVGLLCARMLDLDLPQGRQLRSRLHGLDQELAALADIFART